MPGSENRLARRLPATHMSCRPMLKRTLTIAVVAIAIAATPARAIEGGPAPFDGDLMRLAEILGALHYLRTLCGTNEGQKWRGEMQALLEAEIGRAHV